MSRYFSRVRLAARAHQQRWLRDLARHGEAYRDHALIWKLFPGDGLSRDFVFRSLAEQRLYYVVSARPAVPQAGLLEVQSKPYEPHVESGEFLHFDLRVNPTVSQRVEGGRSQRHDVLMHAKRLTVPGEGRLAAVEAAGRDWIVDRANNWGLDVNVDALLQSGYCQHRLRHKGRRIEFSSLDFQGLARVTDPERLRRALLDGVGHAKAFGCGLLLVRRMS